MAIPVGTVATCMMAIALLCLRNHEALPSQHEPPVVMTQMDDMKETEATMIGSFDAPNSTSHTSQLIFDGPNLTIHPSRLRDFGMTWVGVKNINPLIFVGIFSVTSLALLVLMTVKSTKNAAEPVQETSPALLPACICGNVLLEGNVFCAKCSKKRQEAATPRQTILEPAQKSSPQEAPTLLKAIPEPVQETSPALPQTCLCGDVLLQDHVSCCKCGEKRQEAPTSPKATPPMPDGVRAFINVVYALLHTIPTETWNCQIFTLLAFMCNSLLWRLFLTTDWAIGTTICTSGLLYLALPYHLIPSRCSRLGFVDAFLAILVVGYGLHLMLQADQIHPMPYLVREFLDKATSYDEVNFFNVFLLVSIISLVLSSAVRYTIIGFEVIFGIPCLAFGHFQPPYAVAISLLLFGLFRNALKPILEILNIHGVFPFTSHGWLAGIAALGYALYMEIPNGLK